jgi:hypothetical protein
VQMVRRASAIISLDVGPLDTRNDLRVRVVKAIRGKLAAESVTIDLSKSSANRLSEVREVLGDGHRRALLFIERPRANGVAGAPAALKIGNRWFMLTGAGPGQWTMNEEDEGESRLQAVWAGSTEMLERAVEYILNDPNATVPAAAVVRWATRKQVATVEGRVAAAAAIDLHGNGRLALFLASESGDRLLEYDPAVNKFRDRPAGVKLGSKSRIAAWGHFAGSRRLDLASFDGKRLTLWQQNERGAFEARPIGVALPRDCIGLAAIDTGAAGRSGLLVSTAAAPILLVPADDASFQARELPAAGTESELGHGQACVVADLDGDGIVDVIQPRTASSVFYRGKSPGVFEAPHVIKSLGTGTDGRAAFVGDWDGDGLLDLFVVGENGCFAWRNLGKGCFQDVYEETGEVAYKAQRNAIGGTACDVNNDGRQDIVLAYADQTPQTFFNRGFFTFGFAEELKLEDDHTIADLDRGLQAAVAADFVGNGVESLVFVLKEGSVWMLSPSAEKSSASKLPAGHAVSVRLPEGSLDPVTVVGYDGSRCLGARLAAPGSPAWFGRQVQGSLKLRWHDSAGREQIKSIDVRGSTSFILPMTKESQP